MSEKTESPALLSPERRTQIIKRVCLAPHIANADIDIINAGFDALADHDNFRQMVATELRLLLYDESIFPQLDQAHRTACFIRNTQVKNMARALAIDLTAPTSPTS